MTVFEISGDLARMDAALEALPNSPAVFAIWPHDGAPYLSKTGVLRRRLLRLLRERQAPSRMLNLRHAAARIEYRLTGSALESSVVLYEEARQVLPDSYVAFLKLRMPRYLNLALDDPFPRTRITTRLTRGGLFFGPFRSRASAERFESKMLDLFQIRRCREALAPSAAHPGCIYGEIGWCLRPCQEVVGASEYAREAGRTAEFLRTGGRAMLAAIGRSRDRLSEEMCFEEAASQHKRYERVREVVELRDELACELHALNGIAITRSVEPQAVELWPVAEGGLLAPRRFGFDARDGKTAPMDRALREALEGLEARPQPISERQERLALLARWRYSSWCDGEWLGFERWNELPYRKLVNAISRVARPAAEQPAGPAPRLSSER